MNAERRKIVLGSETHRLWVGALVAKYPAGSVVTLEPARRSLAQNAALHSALAEIAEQVEWHGQKFSMEIWKRLCTAAWLREKGESPLLVPALDGNGVDIIFERTSRLSVSQCSELLEWCYAFGAQNGVKFNV